MRRKRAALFLTAGALCLLSAAVLAGYNLWDDQRAGASAQKAVAVLQQEIPEEPETTQPITPEAKPMMTAVEIDGRYHIGLLEIPALGLSLPVMSEWSYPNLKLAPCRYSGSAYTGNFTIAGHNYSTHFGPIGGLNAGDSITFTDMQGNRFAYEVQVVETLEATAVADMVSKEWDLTLFTCDLSGESRVTVRCLQV